MQQMLVRVKRFMKKILFALSIVALTIGLASACPASTSTTETQQQKKMAMYGIAFYNLENLFDTIHAPGKNDYDFLPNGPYRWNTKKYQSKLKNMSRVVSELCTDKLPRVGAAVVGVSEVENRSVVLDLVHQPALKDRGYRVLHVDSPDRRGVDCALLYNPRLFQLEDSLYVPYIYPDEKTGDKPLGFTVDSKKAVHATPLYGDTTHITRGFLVGIGRMGGERVGIVVNHWPSRGAESPARERAGWQVRKLCDALYAMYDGDIKMIVMGDLNDDPDNKSMTEGMQCKFEAGKLKDGADFFNPWYYTLRKNPQLGTLMYQGKWNLFDQILVSGNAVDHSYDLKKAAKNQIKASDLDLSHGLTFYRHDRFVRDYLFQQEGKYKGSPLRTTAGGTWLNGYSDHLPTQIYLIKEM